MNRTEIVEMLRTYNEQKGKLRRMKEDLMLLCTSMGADTKVTGFDPAVWLDGWLVSRKCIPEARKDQIGSFK